MRLSLPLLIAVLATPLQAQPAARWYRGNTHVHTTESDGNGMPAEVAQWYHDHGYDFVVITDHEKITDVAPLQARLGDGGRFLVMQGQEVTQQVADAAHPQGRRQAHVSAVGVGRVVLPLGEKGIAHDVSIAATYARNLPAVRAAGGVPIVNHPNFRWSVGLADMAALPDSTLFEVWNSQPHINNLGGGDGAGHVALSTEALWDSLLTRGTLLFGVASDDAHKFRPEQLRELGLTRPGGGWVMVRADTLTPAAIQAALRAGHFYASTGVSLAEYAVSPRAIRLRVARPTGGYNDDRYHTRFIGRGGRVLAEVDGEEASYTVRGDEGYVRAVVTDSNGRRAWTQPVMVGREG
jgi:hypothetical protein